MPAACVGHYQRGGLLKFAPVLTVALFLVPVLAGLAGTILPAFGYLPALGGKDISLAPFAAFWRYPGIGDAIARTVFTGLISTALSLSLALAITAAFQGKPIFSWIRNRLAPMLAIPHAALAIGLVFLLAPSGWIFRAISPVLTGWDRPPTGFLFPDEYGFTLIAGLVLKETPYLLLMTVAALPRVDAGRRLTLARTLGYGRFSGWMKAVFPGIYPLIRLPVFAVLAYSLSVVDMAKILLPGPSPTLGILILRWFNDPDLSGQFTAAAGSCALFALTALLLCLWLLAERAFKRIGRRAISSGKRGGGDGIATAAASLSASTVAAFSLLSAAALIVWSLTASWRFPDALPSRWTLHNWQAATSDLAAPLSVTVIAALLATGLSAMLSLACLEAESRYGFKPGKGAITLLYIPLIVPQPAFLFGLQIIANRLGASGGWAALVWGHVIFVLPYVFLSLAAPYRAIDRRLLHTAFGLGKGPWEAFARITLPVILMPLAVACAVGIAVSVSQYLPTVFLGAGRLATLTTEAVTLAGGADRRVIGVYATLVSAIPFAGFALAIAIPSWIYRHRKGMKP